MEIGGLCQEFLTHCRVARKLSANTLAAYAVDLQEFCRFAGPDIQAAAIDRGLLRGYLAYLADARGLRPTSVKRRVACLKVMFRWLELEEVLAVNPFHRLDAQIRLPRKLPRTLTREETAALRRTAVSQAGLWRPLTAERVAGAGDHDAVTALVAIEIMLCTGMRVGELAAVRLGDIALAEGVITVNGKGSRQRQVFLPPEEAALLSGYLGYRAAQHFPGDSLLVNRLGGRAGTERLRALVRRVGEAAGLTRRITPHMLRHTAATQLLEHGLDIRHVQRLLGHQSITTTEGYTHVSNASLKNAVLRARAKALAEVA